MKKLAWLLLLIASQAAAAAEIPATAWRYQHTLTAIAQREFGLPAPAALLAAQVHQESSWRADARSPYAGGLAQFTPDTIAWLSRTYKDIPPDAAFNPDAALAALARYNRHIYDRQALPAHTECDRWAFVLSGYNGGPGWIDRDRRLCTASGQCDNTRWFGHVEYHSERAEWAMQENRHYPRRILGELHARYLGAGWRGTEVCTWPG
ncbi:MAG: transglycosylase SLT domain-containing protein [Pseudomonadales bacterium]|nr:transglycosylase SLT domain-containing protein [Pseudomonadales bacterium]